MKRATYLIGMDGIDVKAALQMQGIAYNYLNDEYENFRIAALVGTVARLFQPILEVSVYAAFSDVTFRNTGKRLRDIFDRESITYRVESVDVAEETV